MRACAPALRPFLEEFTDRGVVSVEDLIGQIESRDRQCWAIVIDGELKAVCLTRLFEDRLKICEVTHLAGFDRQAWESAYQELEDWAIAQGCARIKAIARPGWERISKRFGLQKTHVMLEKDL